MANIQPRFEPFRSLTRFDPFQEMEDFFRESSRWAPMLRRFGTESGIRMDITENDQNFVIKAEIPGVAKEDIKVAIDGNQISITAETRQEREQKDENLICNERYYGQMSRNFMLPQDVDDTKAEAHYQNGVLELTLPKKEGGGRKQIAIQ